MVDLNMQQLFWDKLNEVIDRGKYINQETDVNQLGLNRGYIQYNTQQVKTWHGHNDIGEPKLLIKMVSATIETEILLNFSRKDCLKLSTFYADQGVAVEIFNRTCSSSLRNEDSSIFVRTCEIYRESFNRTNQLIAILDKELNLKYANKTLLKYLDMTMNEVIGVPYWDLTLWQHSLELQNKIVFSLEQMHLGNEVRYETTYQNKMGELRDIDFVIKPIIDHNNEVDLLIAMGYDVTESKLAESALKRTEKEMKLFFDYSVNGYYINRLEESIFLDPETLDDVFGYVQRHEKIISYNNAILQHIDIPATTFENTNVFDLLRVSKEKSKALWREMIEQGFVAYQADIDVAGVRKILDCTFVPILEDGNRYSGSFGIIKDVTKEVLQERKMIYLATKDSLTGTNNRRHYLESCWASMRALTSQNVHPAVLMIDIDDFKNVNDTYGHDIGDKVLIEMTKTCEEILNSIGIYGRMGGEEFSAFIYNEAGDAIDIAEKIRREIEALVIKSELGKFQFTVSIGYTEVKRGHTMEEALKRADKALYKAKRTGKNKVESILS